VAAQNTIPLAQAWGGGEVASADGIGFIVPVKTVCEFSFKLSPFFLKDVITERLALASSALKILIQPAAMWLLAILLGVTGVYRREMILLGALLTASMTAMFAVQYKVYVAESDATILLSTVLSIATLGVCIALTA
jgi:predicted permease